jgi:hypothetical protein
VEVQQSLHFSYFFFHTESCACTKFTHTCKVLKLEKCKARKGKKAISSTELSVQANSTEYTHSKPQFSFITWQHRRGFLFWEEAAPNKRTKHGKLNVRHKQETHSSLSKAGTN